MAPSLNTLVGNPYSSFRDDQRLVSDTTDDGTNDDNNTDAELFGKDDDDEDNDDNESRATDMFEEQFIFGDR